jgi:PAS domain S-box-containing protein
MNPASGSSSQPIPLDKQILGLSQQAGRIRSSLLTLRDKLVPNTLEELSFIESRLYKTSQEVGTALGKYHNLEALANIGQLVNSTIELDEVLRIVMDTIVRLTGAERGFLMLRDEHGELAIRIARNWEQESIGASESLISRTVIRKVIEGGEAVITTNAQEDPRFGGQESIVAYNLRSILCVPLKVKNELIGVIYADNRMRTGIFTDVERDLLIPFSNQAAVALENARLFDSLRRTLEEVTELKNLMDNIFASITSGVITADVEDQITLSNRAAESIIGRTTAEMLGQRLSDVLPAVAENIIPQVATVRTTNSPVTDLEFTLQSERGRQDWRFSLSPLRDASHATQGVAIVLDDLTERRRLEAQRKLFERMVSPAVIAQIDPNGLALGGRRVDITTLFADVRGFTSFSEQQASPEQLVAVLNRYLAAAAEAVLEQEGTVDKFLGDAVMAWFNAPIRQPDHTLRAVRAALAIRAAIERLHRELPPSEHLAFGVGLHYGDAILGLIGTEKRLEYTAIGDSVNTAKRIQENSGRGQIVISQAAYERVQGEVEVAPLEPMQVKGKREPLSVYEVLGLK